MSPLATCLCRCAASSPHQQQNAVRLIHVCLSTLMKVGLPKPVAMEGSVVFSALQEVLFLQGAAPQVGGGGSWSSQLGVKTQKQHTAEQQVRGWLVGWLVGWCVC